jgi:hypothetical protein
MRQRFSHLSSKKRGDLAILSAHDYLIYDQISKQPLSQAIADIKMVSLINSQGTWTQATSRHKDKIENPGLLLQEKIKNQKHAAFFTLLLALLFFHLLSPSLALLDLQQFVVSILWLIWNCANTRLFSVVSLAPMDPSARSQYRAISYRQISARIGLAVAKASVESCRHSTTSPPLLRPSFSPC